MKLEVHTTDVDFWYHLSANIEKYKSTKHNKQQNYESNLDCVC